MPRTNLTQAEQEIWGSIWPPIKLVLLHHFAVFYAEVIDKMLSRKDVPARVFIYTQKGSAVRVH